MQLWLTHSTCVRVTEWANIEIRDTLHPSGQLRDGVDLRGAITKQSRPRTTPRPFSPTRRGSITGAPVVGVCLPNRSYIRWGGCRWPRGVAGSAPMVVNGWAGSGAAAGGSVLQVALGCRSVRCSGDPVQRLVVPAGVLDLVAA